MKGRFLVFFAMSLMLFSLAFSQAPSKEKLKAQAKTESPVSMLIKAMTSRLPNSLHVKYVVGDPVKVGKVTIIPIMMVDVGFGGGGGGPTQGKGQQMGGFGFGMGGEAKPLGFVVVSKAGTKFVSVGKVPRK